MASNKWLMHPWTMRTLEANICQTPRIITRNDTVDVHRLDSKPSPNWLHGGFHHLHTHPHASKIVQSGCITASNMATCPGDVTGRSGWRPWEPGHRSLWRLCLSEEGPSIVRLRWKLIHLEGEDGATLRSWRKRWWGSHSPPLIEAF